MHQPPFNLFDPETIEDPLPFYDWLRREAPVYEVPGAGNFLVSRFDDIRKVCTKPDVFSSRLVVVIQRDHSGEPRLLETDLADEPHGSVLGAADGEAHRRQREALSRTFTPRQMRSLEDSAREIAHQRVESCLAARESDLMRDFAAPIPCHLMTHELLGLPLGDQSQLQEWSDAAISLMGGVSTNEEFEENGRRVRELQAYLAEHFEAALRAPADNVMGRLARSVNSDGGLNLPEALGVLYQLVVGGSETTVGLIGSAIQLAVEIPEMLDRLRQNPSEIPAFIEEVHRYETPARGSYRRTTLETELGGVRLPVGSTLNLLWASGNRDETEFERPDEFILERPNIKAHLGFGHGAHFCLGAAMARMETCIALETLLEKTSSIELLQSRDQLRHVPSLLIRRLVDLNARLES